jgi:hypothetical protein
LENFEQHAHAGPEADRVFLSAARGEPRCGDHRDCGGSMGKGKKTDVQFILPDPEPHEPELDLVEESFLEAPYTSILMSTAAGDG